ncbi:Protein phosphatase methylesterase 1 [Acipenser ruthenus]|uniref:protein phosphatase methylesterase-1 n=1 Tax=Acipenser ruthenus TaxID=7906 RepID=A0A662YLS5_ACIRT|nr:Protein phosphatase methylesterase 1 [Acipenser ruthenus]
MMYVFYSALELSSRSRVLAMDLRGHGDTQVRNTDDLSAQTMSKDVANVVRAIYGEIPPSLLLVGHNMGGAIAIHTATANLIPSVVGLVVIDVVEGKFMMQVLAHCGHAVHEDIPDKVAEALASFMIRQKFAEAKSGNKRKSLKENRISPPDLKNGTSNQTPFSPF